MTKMKLSQRLSRALELPADAALPVPRLEITGRNDILITGKAVLLVSLELEEVMSLSDRILVMYEGEIVGELDPKTTTVEELGLYMAGAKRMEVQ